MRAKPIGPIVFAVFASTACGSNSSGAGDGGNGEPASSGSETTGSSSGSSTGSVVSSSGTSGTSGTASGSPTSNSGSSGVPSTSGSSSAGSPGSGSSDAGDAGTTSSELADGGSDSSAAADSSPSSDGGPQPFKGIANSPCADLTKLGASWYYNWEVSPSPPCSSPPQFVPMVWGHTGAEQSSSGIASEIRAMASAGYTAVLGFNEPDNSSQSNISVPMAISLWPAVAGNRSLRVGSPATQGNGTGLTWTQSFMSQVNADTTGTLRVDFIATHWYGWNAGSCDSKAANLESWIKQIEAIPGNRPIWLTEWGCLHDSNPDAATVQAFFSGAVAMFAKHPRIERYAWYPWTTNNEVSTDSGGQVTLTSLGNVFVAARAYR